MARRNLVATLGFLVLLAASATPSEKPKSVPPSSPNHAYGHRISLPGVPNAGEVTARLYRGAQPTADGYRELKKMGIDIVVDLRLTGRDKERRAVLASGMQYVSIPWHCYFPKDKFMARFLALLRENQGKRIFVHCRYGDDRTGMMLAAYRMANEGWTAEEARKEMNVFGFHHLVCPALGSYEKHFPERFAHNKEFKALREADHQVKKK